MQAFDVDQDQLGRVHRIMLEVPEKNYLQILHQKSREKANLRPVERCEGLNKAGNYLLAIISWIFGILETAVAKTVD
jgi:hypothetical protein